MLQLATGEDIVPQDPTGFSRLFNDYHGLIFRTAYRITGNAADAEDVLQGIFLRLMSGGSAAAPANAESYFRRAAVNASIDVLRRRREGPSLLDEEPGPRSSNPEAKELRESLRLAFAKLSARSAEIFALRYFEEFTNGQIAEMLGMSQVLVAVTIHRARRQLQKEIDSYFGGRR